jgi:subtilisin family serine protease
LTSVQASELHQNPVVSSAAVGIAEYSPVAIKVQGINEDRLIPLDLETMSGAAGTPLSPDCPPESCSHGKRDGNILVQATPLQELRMISQAREARGLAQLPGYAYDSVGGMGITVYVIDTGINPNHPVSVTDYPINNKTHCFPGIHNPQRKHTSALSPKRTTS